MQDIYVKKKRRVTGEILQEAQLKNNGSWVYIHKSSNKELVTYESQGSIVSINGSGTLRIDHPQAQEAAKLTDYIIKNKGIIVTGGRNSGIMQACNQVAKENNLGIIFPELKKEASQYGPKAIINSPMPRVELLATCTPIVVIFRGGLGSLMILMRSIVHLKNRQYHPEQLPQLVFVHNYWIGLLSTMMNMGCLPREFLTELNFFDRAEQIIEKLPKIK